MAYDPDCIFCRIAAAQVPSQKVYEDERVVAFVDANPKAPVHVLVIPRDHLTDVRDLNDHGLLGRIFEVANQVAVDKGVGESGYRLVFNVGPDAGQSVFHTHLHLLGGRPLAWPPG